MLRLQSFIGIFIIIALAWLISEKRKNFQWRVVIGALALQFVLALLLLKLPDSQKVFQSLTIIVDKVQQATKDGTMMVFGYLGGGDAPFVLINERNRGFIFAFQALPLVLVVSVLSALLYHWRILPMIVKGFSIILKKATGIGGAVGLSTAANIFVGMVEAPLIIRPYVSKMSRSELFITMTGGMATIAGTVLILYSNMLKGIVPGAVGHILTASIISAPAAIMVSIIMVPEKQIKPLDKDPVMPRTAESTMDALVKGVESGLSLLLNIIAMLIVLIALVSLVNMFLEIVPGPKGTALSLQRILGWIMAPIVWLTGIPWPEAMHAGQLMGIKTILNELIAYYELSTMSDVLCERSRIIMTYSLCGFANLGSLGIMIGGLKVIAPDRIGDILSLGYKSIISGTLATLITGCIVGILI